MNEKIIELRLEKTQLDLKNLGVKALLVLIALCAAIYLIGSKLESKASDFLRAKEAWNKKEYDVLRSILKKHPELGATYGNKLAQIELAENFCEMSRFEMEKALAECEKITADPNSDLYAFTLMKIAILKGELGDIEGEKKSWRELEAAASFPRLVEHFRKQNVPLSEYLLSRG